jgi:hypothetical protein
MQVQSNASFSVYGQQLHTLGQQDTNQLTSDSAVIMSHYLYSCKRSPPKIIANWNKMTAVSKKSIIKNVYQTANLASV